MKVPRIVLLLALASGVVPAFAEADLSKLPAPSDKKGLTYAKDIKPILEASCFRCHGADRQKGGLRLDSLEAVLKGGEDGKVVEPKKSKDSLLVVAVSGLDPEKAMPPKRKPGGPGGPGGRPGGQSGVKPGGPGTTPPGGPGGGPPGGPGGPGGGGFGGPPPKDLTPEQVGLIRAWIDQGAK